MTLVYLPSWVEICDGAEHLGERLQSDSLRILSKVLYVAKSVSLCHVASASYCDKDAVYPCSVETALWGYLGCRLLKSTTA
jgi:hypothetical protein